jgi:hypothetical protein
MSAVICISTQNNGIHTLLVQATPRNTDFKIDLAVGYQEAFFGKVRDEVGEKVMLTHRNKIVEPGL